MKRRIIVSHKNVSRSIDVPKDVGEVEFFQFFCDRGIKYFLLLGKVQDGSRALWLARFNGVSARPEPFFKLIKNLPHCAPLVVQRGELVQRDDCIHIIIFLNQEWLLYVPDVMGKSSESFKVKSFSRFPIAFGDRLLFLKPFFKVADNECLYDSQGQEAYRFPSHITIKERFTVAKNILYLLGEQLVEGKKSSLVYSTDGTTIKLLAQLPGNNGKISLFWDVQLRNWSPCVFYVNEEYKLCFWSSNVPDEVTSIAQLSQKDN